MLTLLNRNIDVVNIEVMLSVLLNTPRVGSAGFLGGSVGYDENISH